MSNNRCERQSFSENIQRMALKQKITHIEAIINHCETTGLEIEQVDQLLTKNLRDIIEHEGVKSRGLKSQNSTMKLI